MTVPYVIESGGGALGVLMRENKVLALTHCCEDWNARVM